MRSQRRHDATRLPCWQICSDSSRLSPTSCAANSVHTADATQLDSWVASASAVCIWLKVVILRARVRVVFPSLMLADWLFRCSVLSSVLYLLLRFLNAAKIPQTLLIAAQTFQLVLCEYSTFLIESNSHFSIRFDSKRAQLCEIFEYLPSPISYLFNRMTPIFHLSNHA